MLELLLDQLLLYVLFLVLMFEELILIHMLNNVNQLLNHQLYKLELLLHRLLQYDLMRQLLVELLILRDIHHNVYLLFNLLLCM